MRIRCDRCQHVLLAIVLPCVIGGCAQLQTVAVNERPRVLRDFTDPDVVVRANDNCQCGEEGCMRCSRQVEFGRPNKVVDGVGWVFGIPAKVLLWDRRAENHQVSAQTTSCVQTYLQENGLRDVKVRVNQYAPGDEWRRLAQNTNVSPLWRYSVGALNTLGYTILPGRLFGGDNYNPFTNTISIYSDIPAVAIHEAAYAKDNAAQQLPGTYGFAQQVPGLNIWHETQATKLAHHWMQHSQDPQLVRESHRVLAPLYGMRVGDSIGGLLPAGDSLLAAAGAITGHAVGANLSQRQAAGIASNDHSNEIQHASFSVAH